MAVFGDLKARVQLVSIGKGARQGQVLEITGLHVRGVEILVDVGEHAATASIGCVREVLPSVGKAQALPARDGDGRAKI